jgi:ethanolamine utilization cobalamin adenosyltransferase
MAYLIAPPIEAVLGLDAALKAAEVEMKVFYPPPSETNFSGGLLTGELHEVEAAAKAFQEKVLELAARPRELTPSPAVELLAATFGKTAARRQGEAARPFRLVGSGLELDAKPSGYTHLKDNLSLVPKGDPVIRFRGKLDLLQAYVIEAAVEARREGFADVAQDLGELLGYLRRLMSAEVMGTAMPELAMAGFTCEELHRVSHRTKQLLNVGWVLPDPSMGAAVSKLNLLRAFSREVELASLDAFDGRDHLTAENREALQHGLNRLSNIIYVLVCKLVGRQSLQPGGGAPPTLSGNHA